MPWIRLDIPCDPDAADVVAAIVLAETGRGASVLEHGDLTLVQAWLPENWQDDMTARLRGRLEAAGPPYSQWAARMTPTLVPDEDWSLGWRRHFTAFRVGRRLVVKPSWEPWPPEDRPEEGRPDDLVIEIDPGEAFGTGTHASTQLALRALEETVAPGDMVVDVGCGSGILSLAAVLLGARRAIAVDFDPAAVRCARSNLRAQRMTARSAALIGEGLTALRLHADVIVANITAEGALAVGLQAPERLRPGGRYIVSGFLETSVPWLQRTLGRLGFRVVRSDRLDGWAALILAREEGSA